MSEENASEPSEASAESAGEGDVTAADVRHVAGLARVDIGEADGERFAEHFEAILEYFETLDEVPETDAEPDLTNVLRADEIEEGLTREEALRNAPETEDGYFKGPRVS
jgi:aspartyl-tRNA(Asn)/glutamyl-tRNA(Gln) amidotransferase subunit C